MSELQEMYQQLFNAIKDADEKLDSLSDTEAAGKRKITNELVEKFQGEWQAPAASLVSQMKEFDADRLTGVYQGIVRELRKAFDETTSKHVASLAENAPKVEPLISEDEAKQLSADRSEAYQRIKHVIELAVSFGIVQEGEWEMPAARRGARGRRGRRALSFYTWTIDGVPVSADANTPAAISKLLGFEKAKEFSELLRSNNIETAKPPAEFSITVNGKEVKAVRNADAPSEEELSDEGDEDDDLEDEEENGETNGDAES